MKLVREWGWDETPAYIYSASLFEEDGNFYTQVHPKSVGGEFVGFFDNKESAMKALQDLFEGKGFNPDLCNVKE